MADAFAERFGHRIRELFVSRGGHPLPDAESFAAGARALQLADDSKSRNETLIVLLSGGASAMMAAPAPGVSLEDKIALTRDLLRSGKPIAEMNAARKRLSAIKGGKLALRAGRSVTFAISDVHSPIEDDPAIIGSGPTVGDPPIAGATFVLIGSRRDAMGGAAAAARRLGYDATVVQPPTLGEARDAARAFFATGPVARALSHAPVASGFSRKISDMSRKISDMSRKLCVIASGETTVTLGASHGVGGRNQEFALAGALAMARIEGVALASIGTDGIDGPTNAAGAIADGTTIPRAQSLGLDASVALARHDSYPFFQALGDLVITGPTGTNVGDLQVFLCSSRHT
jgi:glycerate-2-kinase